MRRLWIIFSQTATICLAALFVVSTLKPEWLPSRSGLVPESMRVATLHQEAQPGAAGGGARPDSYHDAVQKAAPSVVNIFTSKEVRVTRNPLLNDPLFRRFFGDQFGGSLLEAQQTDHAEIDGRPKPSRPLGARGLAGQMPPRHLAGLPAHLTEVRIDAGSGSGAHEVLRKADKRQPEYQ